MAKYIYAEEVPESKQWYITPKKRYEVLGESNNGKSILYFIEADGGEKVSALNNNCAHLKGGSWIETDTP